MAKGKAKRNWKGKDYEREYGEHEKEKSRRLRGRNRGRLERK